MRYRTPIWLVFILSTLIAISIFVQAYLITAYVTGNADALDAHETVGVLTHLVEIVVFLLAVIGWWGAWRWIGFVFLLPLVGTVQLMLAPASGDADRGSPWVRGFHGLLALVVLVLAAVIAHRGMRDLGLRRAHSAAAGADTPLSPP